MDEAQFVNIYIQRLLKEIDDLTKNRMMNEARIIMLEQSNAEFIQQLERQTKKINKGNKEVNTSAE